MRTGILHAIGAYIFWGLFPVFWKQLHGVNSLQVIAHRIVWSLFLLLIAIFLSSDFTRFKAEVLQGQKLRIYLLASFLIGFNWVIYVWGVNSGHIVETSLGYFINPVLSVLLGVFFFKEKLRFNQWLSVGLAFGGVLYLALALNSFPWIAISLAVSFSLYGLVKKIAPLNPLSGLTLETSLLFIPAFVFLIFLEWQGSGSFIHAGFQTSLYLVLAGMVTILPLLLFASAAQKIPLSFVGIFQYISPTLQLLCGIVIYKEGFSGSQLLGYGLIWLALLVLAIDGFVFHKSSK